MRLPNSEFTSRPWRIHELTHDFRLEDVWELPALFCADDFPRLVDMIAALDLSQSSSVAVRTLVAVRWKLGELFQWDNAEKGVDSKGPTLRDRLPADLLDGPRGPESDTLPFSSLYLVDDEWAAELANRTVHGVIHVGRVADPSGGFRAQMAVLVKPNGPCGTAYMAAIRPFRHLIIYPTILREGERTWRSLTPTRRSGVPT